MKYFKFYNPIVSFLGFLSVTYYYFLDTGGFFSIEGSYYLIATTLLIINILKFFKIHILNIFVVSLLINLGILITICFNAFFFAFSLFGFGFSGQSIPFVWIFTAIINIVLFSLTSIDIFIRCFPKKNSDENNQIMS